MFEQESVEVKVQTEAATLIGRDESQATLTIDLSAYATNWRMLAGRAGAAECGAVVKADAYGIGIEAAVPALEMAGCRSFFVAHASEGRRAQSVLRESGARVFLLNGLLPDPGALDNILVRGLIPIIGSFEEWRFWRDDSRTRNAPLALHVNTGMNRLGMLAEEARAIADDPLSKGAVILVMSHFVASEAAFDPLNDQQVAAFAPVRAAFPGVPASLANSSGIFLPSRPHYDLVRPGYSLYGGNPTPGQPNPMRSVVRLDAPIIQVRDIGAGETVGYNARWTATRPTRLATIGVGYADGLPRSASSIDGRTGGEAIVAGVRCPFAGRVSMDLIVIDVTDAPVAEVRPGTLAQVLGPDIGIDDLAERAGTIGYEILTSLGRRYHRVYVGM